LSTVLNVLIAAVFV